MHSRMRSFWAREIAPRSSLTALSRDGLGFDDARQKGLSPKEIGNKAEIPVKRGQRLELAQFNFWKKTHWLRSHEGGSDYAKCSALPSSGASGMTSGG